MHRTRETSILLIRDRGMSRSKLLNFLTTCLKKKTFKIKSHNSLTLVAKCRHRPKVNCRARDLLVLALKMINLACSQAKVRSGQATISKTVSLASGTPKILNLLTTLWSASTSIKFCSQKCQSHKTTVTGRLFRTKSVLGIKLEAILNLPRKNLRRWLLTQINSWSAHQDQLFRSSSRVDALKTSQQQEEW